MTRKMFCRLFYALCMIMLITTSSLARSQANDFHFPYLDISLPDHLKLITQREDKSAGLYQYIFSSSESDLADMQVRVIIGNKQPQKGQTLEAFEVETVGYASAVFVDINRLSDYLNSPENKKVLSNQPDKFKLGNAMFTGATMYFGETDATFLVTTSHGTTYVFTLVSRNSNAETRKNNLMLLMKQLETIKFKDVRNK